MTPVVDGFMFMIYKAYLMKSRVSSKLIKKRRIYTPTTALVITTWSIFLSRDLSHNSHIKEDLIYYTYADLHLKSPCFLLHGAVWMLLAKA